MEKVFVDLCREWIMERGEEGIRFRFPAPENARGFYPYGFVRKNDSAADFTDWYGMSLSVLGSGEGERRIRVTAFFADQDPLGVTAGVLLREGRAQVELLFSLFPLETVKTNRWEFVTGFLIEGLDGEIEVTECLARRRNGVFAQFPIRGKSGEEGERITYEGMVYNCSLEPLIVSASQVYEGWESLIAEITPADGNASEGILLTPGSGVPITVSVVIHDYMPAGGHEDTRIRILGRGSVGLYEDSVEFKTLRALPHPYIYHNRDGWGKVRKNISENEAYRTAFEAYRRKADSWVIEPPMEGRDFCYVTSTESFVMSAAYVYAVTGEREYARKIARFYRQFSDPVNGYPARKKGCSQSYVQEGHFFKHLAIPFDIIYDSGEMNEADKAAMEHCFRLYLEMLDTHILDGHISNWILSELVGAFFCALALQDIERALRFVFGTGGIIEQFRHGIFDDGWWHECSVGYNTWVSSMMLHTAHALLPFGYNLIHTYFRIPYNQEVSASYPGRPQEVKSGMFNQKWGGIRKGYVCIKDMFDATLPFLDYRGVLFGIADSDEKRLSGVHFGSTYDLAYHYYRDPNYLPIIAGSDPDPIFGDPGLPKAESTLCMGDAYSDNIGLAMLRSRKPGREQREQIQAVLRYGAHGGAHGHFDITDLLSIMRYGRSFFNPENCWWGYAHFMYKFYVQCSLSKNMVVVDEKMQIPADSRKILWESGDGLSAAGIEVKTRWSYPPYGGMVYYQDGQSAAKEELARRCRMNGCYLPIVTGEGSPVYGEMSDYTEPVLQRRILAVTDDYVVLFDYLEGGREHQYDSLLQIKGFVGLEGGKVTPAGHTEQMNSNPISDAQFITDCTWYEVEGGSKASFHTIFTEEQAGERLNCDRSNYNDPGDLRMDVYTAWPRESRQMIGRVPIYHGWAASANGYTIPLAYHVDLDGCRMQEGEFDGWILGREEIKVSLKEGTKLALCVGQGLRYDETNNPVVTPQGIFWGEIRLTLEDGMSVNVGECIRNGHWKERLTCDNLDSGCGIGRDYQNGRVTIVGTEYPDAVPAKAP